jgi:archaellin
MRLYLKIGFFVLLATLPLLAHTQDKLKAKEGFISFFSSAPLEDIYAKNENVNSLLDVQQKKVAFVVAINGFQFKKKLMQKHFNEKYMESHKYPNALYNGNIITDADLSVPGNYPAKSKGNITIHGVQQAIECEGTLVVSPNNIRLTSTFILKPADFKIKIPKLLVKNIAEEIKVTVDIKYE